MQCGDRTFSTKWAGSFVSFYCYPSAWRIHAYGKRLASGKGKRSANGKGKKIESICLFVTIRTLILQSKHGHKPLNRKEIELLPHSLTTLQMEIKKNTCDSKFPPGLTSLTLFKLPADFDPLYPLPLGITRLGLVYEHTGIKFPTILVPKHLHALKELSTLHLLLPDGILNRTGVCLIPNSVTFLNLGRGGFADQDSIVSVGQFLTNLQSLDCESIFPNWYRNSQGNYDMSVLPQSITRLPFCFGLAPSKRSISQSEIAAGFCNWHHHPRGLRSFESYTSLNIPGGGYDRRIAVKDGGFTKNILSIRVFGHGRISADLRGDPPNEHLMDNISPQLESITLCGVIVSCPLRFVTHLQLYATHESGYIIKQSQIEACRYMSSVTHLVMHGSLDKINDLNICTWRLKSLKINEQARISQSSPLYLNDYLPWITPDLIELVICCGDLLGAEEIELPPTLEIVRIKLFRKAADFDAPTTLLKFITFVED